MTSLWLRHEVRTTEQRAPIAPADAARLVEAGLRLSVEQSAHRCFPIAEYAEAGCQIVPAGSWVDAPAEAYVIGLKELPVTPAELRHRHIYFGHAYKDQPGSEQLLRRFVAGGGALLDIEYLAEDSGRRLAAFGYWAGYLGAALTVLRSRGELAEPLTAGTREALDSQLRAGRDRPQPSALVVGALGRSGRGARDALELAGITATGWDVAETSALDRPALLAHDLLINTVLVTRPVPPFVTAADVADPSRRLRLICDVTCDVGSPFNVLPIYDQVTSWERPVALLRAEPPSLELIAIDNLPALVPVQASLAFSAELSPQLMLLGSGAGQWQRCAGAFEQACRSHGLPAEAIEV